MDQELLQQLRDLVESWRDEGRYAYSRQDQQIVQTEIATRRSCADELEQLIK